ncbi:MAG: exonuclease domain-containing protein [Pirellulaceae bacterium]
MEFVAIDFETANGQPNSACQLAAVVVRDSDIVEEHSWLIRPPRMYFSPMNISVHGIRPKDVADAPTMEEVWSVLSALIDGQTLVAHNARFDMGVLIHSLAAYDIACPAINFACTRVLAKAAWPGKARYGLKPLGTWLGIDFKHHDALEDSRVCARIALAAANAHSQDDLESLEKTLRVSRGHYRHSHLQGPRMIGRRSGSSGSRTSTDRFGFPTAKTKRPLGSIDPEAVVTAAAQELPLAGKRITMLGPLRGLDIEGTLQLIAKLGGITEAQITANTDYVVACGTTLADASELMVEALARNAATSATVANATDEAPRHSCGIRLLSERQFLALLPAGKSTIGW